jgi:serralysin
MLEAERATRARVVSGEGSPMAVITGDGDDNTLEGTPGSDLMKGAGGHDTLFGYYGEDTLYGMEGDDALNGGNGADKMYGGAGSDGYIVDTLLDLVAEEEDGGIADRVVSYVASYTIGAHVEQLQLGNMAHVKSGYGNVLDNVLVGNDFDNVLKGGAGNDTFYEGIYIVPSGNDIWYGGFDDDIYYIRSAGMMVVEYADQGTDKAYAYISYQLTANVEELQLVNEVTAVDGFGNDLDNRILGNSYDNTLAGGAGDDDLFGYAGNDVLIGGPGADYIHGDIGIDTLSYQSSTSAVLVNLGNGMAQGGDAAGDTFNNATIDDLAGSIYHDALFGSGLANLLNGGGGNDALFGGLNNDVFAFDFSVGGWFGHDTVLDFVKGEDKLQFDDAQFSNFAAVQAKISQVGADTVITYDAGNSITIENVTAATLQASDFVFV